VLFRRVSGTKQSVTEREEMCFWTFKHENLL